jgi:hypothetical protein
MHQVRFPTLLFTAGCMAVSVFPAAVSAQQPVSLASTRKEAAALPPAELNAIRAATEKYRDVKAAWPITSGTRRTCDRGHGGAASSAPWASYFRLTCWAWRAISRGARQRHAWTFSNRRHDIRAAGRRLATVAIENLVWAKAWQDAGNKEAPSFHGFDYYYMQDNPLTAADEAHGFEPHYELHFWLYKNNPAGMFAPFNSTVTCEYHVQ